MKKTTMPPPTQGRREQAKRWAVNAFERWNNVTGYVPEHTGYYYEIIGLIEDAADIGFGVAHGQSLKSIGRVIDGGSKGGRR